MTGRGFRPLKGKSLQKAILESLSKKTGLTEAQLSDRGMIVRPVNRPEYVHLMEGARGFILSERLRD